MARPIRIEYPGAVYYITSRGNANRPVFKDDQDRKEFLELLGQLVDRFKWRCHAYCLMNKHYHLLIETPKANLSQGMRQLNGIYTQNFNRRHRRAGHVFQGRFKAILIDKKNYLLDLATYVVLNPVRLRVVKSPLNYKWSSYKATAGIVKAPPFLTTDWILSQFGKQLKTAHEKYRSRVRETIKKPKPWGGVRRQVLLGDEKFVSGLEPYLKGEEKKEKLTQIKRVAKRPTLRKLFDKVSTKSKKARDHIIRGAHLKYGYTLADIGKVLGLHYSTISKIVNETK
jgi:putative transposase